jgi:hypothetical protein
MKNSTHKIEWRAVEDPYKNNVDDLEEFGASGVEDL